MNKAIREKMEELASIHVDDKAELYARSGIRRMDIGSALARDLVMTGVEIAWELFEKEELEKSLEKILGHGIDKKWADAHSEIKELQAENEKLKGDLEKEVGYKMLAQDEFEKLKEQYHLTFVDWKNEAMENTRLKKAIMSALDVYNADDGEPDRNKLTDMWSVLNAALEGESLRESVKDNK